MTKMESEQEDAGKWIEAFVILGLSETEFWNQSAGSRNGQSGKASIVKCVPEASQKDIPPQFGVCCLPLGVQARFVKDVLSEPLEIGCDQYTVVLTDHMGEKTYVFCLAFETTCQYDKASDGEEEKSIQVSAVAKTCVCLVTKVCLYEAFKSIMTALYHCGLPEMLEMGCEGKALAEMFSKISSLPQEQGKALYVVLPMGPKTLNLKLYRTNCIADGASAPSTHQIKRLLELDENVLLSLFESLLLERKIVPVVWMHILRMVFKA